MTSAAREYSDMQKRKTVKWFVARGSPIPTPQDNEALVQGRNNAEELKRAQRRHKDCNRRECETSDVAAVPVSLHPLYADDQISPEKPSFVVGAATAILTRKHLHEQFASMCWIALARQRVHDRLARVAKRLESAHTVARRSVRGDPTTLLALVTMPSFIPATASAPALASAEAPTPSTVTVQFPLKQLKCPFEFRQKDYGPSALPEHPFASRVPPENVAALPCGASQVVEALSEKPPIQLQEVKQPLVTLETYSLYEFAFSKFTTGEGLVQGTQLQVVSNGQFCSPNDPINYQHQVETYNKPADYCRRGVVDGPTPAMLASPDPEDELSDSDHEDAGELPQVCLESLESLASAFLPPFNNAKGKPTTSPATSPATDVLAHGMLTQSNGIARQLDNAVALQRRQHAQQWRSSIVDSLPLPLRTTF